MNRLKADGCSEVKMLKYEPFKRENKNTDRKQTGIKAEPSSGFLMAADEGVSFPGHTLNPQIDEHARLYAGARSEKQRAELAVNLQHHYGNRYVQRVAEKYNNSIRPAPHPIQSASASLKTGTDNSSVCANFKTIVRGKEGAEEGAHESGDTLESKQETGELPGSKDSISPAYIGLAQQTSVGGSPMTGTNHGSYTPHFIKDVVVEKRGFLTWEVRSSLIVNYNWSIQSLGKKDVPDAYSESVEPSKWPDIVTDLRPGSSGIPRSPRFHYWCSDLSAEHEMYHINDCTQAFKAFLPEEEAWLAQQPTAGRKNSQDLGFQALNQLIDKVKQYMGEGNESSQEERAYGAGAAEYEERAQSVYDRAYAEGWMDEEQKDEYEDYGLEPEEVEPEDEEEGDGWWSNIWPEDEESEEEEQEEEEPEEEEPTDEEDGEQEYGYGEEPDGGEEQDGGYEGGYAEESYEEEEEDGGYSGGYGSESSEEEYY
jgi:hypothetical protein